MVTYLNKIQQKALSELRNKYHIIYHRETPNTFECHEMILNAQVSIWIKPDGNIFNVDLIGNPNVKTN